MLSYIAKIKQDGSNYQISFPDIPEANSCSGKAHLLEMAKDALLTSLEFYKEDRKAIPLPNFQPSETNPGEITMSVYIPTCIALKIYLHNEMIKQGIDKLALFKVYEKLGIRDNEYSYLINMKSKSHIEVVEKALINLGFKFNIYRPSKGGSILC